MYVGDNAEYTGCLSLKGGFYYVWIVRLYDYMGNSRKSYHCPSALPEAAWDPDINETIRPRPNPFTGKVDNYAVTDTTRFSVGINDWGIHVNIGQTPQLGLGGDIDGPLYKGPIKESTVKNPSDMIAFGDVPSVKNAGLIRFNANMDPQNSSLGHTSCPANRHNHRVNLAFADGHVESPKRNDVRNLNDDYWRARWNNDNDPHRERGNGSWVANPSWLNVLDQ